MPRLADENAGSLRTGVACHEDVLRRRCWSLRWPSAARAALAAEAPRLALRRTDAPSNADPVHRAVTRSKLMEAAATSTVRRSRVVQTAASRAGGSARPSARAAPASPRVDARRRSARATAMRRRMLEAELQSEEERQAELQKRVQQRRARAPGDERNYQKYLDRVADMKAADRAQARATSPRIKREIAQAAVTSRPARAAGAARDAGLHRARRPALRGLRPAGHAGRGGRRADGAVLFANAGFEDAARHCRAAALLRGSLFDWFADAARAARHASRRSRSNDFATSRLRGHAAPRPRRTRAAAGARHRSAQMRPRRRACSSRCRRIEQQTRQDREERALDQAQANKELIRNLAHEIKNPLGGIRGAAQLLRDGARVAASCIEYTQVIIHEADRLQALVDRLLAPHRRPHVVGDVNIHEVLRARALADPGGVSARPARSSATTTSRSPSSAATASS